MFKHALRAAALLVAATLATGTAALADPAPAPAPKPQLVITAKLDSPPPVFYPGDVAVLEIEVKNTGDVPAEIEKVVVTTTPDDMAWRRTLDDVKNVVVPAGGTYKNYIAGSAKDNLTKDIAVRVDAKVKGDAFEVKAFEQILKVADPTKKAPVAGVVVGDGKGLAGGTVEVYANSKFFAKTTTDAQGRFSFTGVPTGLTSVRVRDLPDGWVTVDSTEITLDDKGETNLRIEAQRPLSDFLKSTIKFEQDDYQPGDSAKLTVTLTNSGKLPVTGIIAECWSQSKENNRISTDGFGDLRESAGGVTVNAGETKTVPVTAVVPADAAKWGVVEAYCRFGTKNDLFRGVHANAYARVPAPAADTWGVLHDLKDESKGIAGLKVSLVDKISGKVVATATTNDQGRVDYRTVPAGVYTAKLEDKGQWKLWRPGIEFHVGSCTDYCKGGWRLPVVADGTPTDPGTTEPGKPGDPAQPGENPQAPAPQAKPGFLASTGASVLGLIGGSILLLGAGAGAIWYTRRRRTA
ncbi:hypothetical protein D5S17_28595 [Pseudonocardiaceae bacterium YIM PH 21723]|nr:hypothetical protein D5S17_28595 [Pseudonocardiaceae bacterium YIM PH 21723]